MKYQSTRAYAYYSRYGNPVGATPAAWNAIFLAAAALDPLTV